MYKALIVDDEIAAREIIKHSINWSNLGFDDPILAKNGKEALEICHKTNFDIILTDIEMPIMDGLIFIEKIKEINPNQVIIVLSCHENFSYAQKAMKLGVKNYIIKDLVNPDELYSQIIEIFIPHNINQSNLTMKNEGEVYLKKIINNDPLTDEEVLSFVDKLKKNQCSSIVSLKIIIDGYENFRDTNEKNKLDSNINKFSKELRKKSIALVKEKKDKFAMLYKGVNSTSMLTFINTIVNLTSNIRQLASSYGINSLSIGISEQTFKLEKLQEIMYHSELACEMRAFNGFNRNLFYSFTSNKQMESDKKKILECLKSVKELLFATDANFTRYIGKLYNIQLTDGFAEMNCIEFINMNLITILFDALEKCHIDYETFANSTGYNINRIEEMETIKEMEVFFNNVFTQIINIQKNQKLQSGSTVNKAKYYIQKNINEELSLNIIASELHVHKGYLCRIFKEETGENLMHYIMETKIDKAKNMLLNTDKKLSEISSNLGFATPQYFSIVFKKYTNMTPKDFKISHEKIQVKTNH